MCIACALCVAQCILRFGCCILCDPCVFRVCFMLGVAYYVLRIVCFELCVACVFRVLHVLRAPFHLLPLAGRMKQVCINYRDRTTDEMTDIHC